MPENLGAFMVLDLRLYALSYSFTTLIYDRFTTYILPS
jgi:hypothetical protein